VTFLPYTRRIYRPILPDGYRALKSYAFSPGGDGLVCDPARRAGILPAASFRFHLAMDTLAVRLTVPAIRVRRGLSPPSHPVITTMTGTAPVKALRAMPGAQNKKDSAKNPPSP